MTTVEPQGGQDAGAPTEAPWVTEMRRHFAEYGFYRREDMERLLGKPGDSVQVTHDGKVVYKSVRP